MASNEWHQWQPPGGRPPERRPYPQPYGAAPYIPRPHMPEDTHKELFVEVERKVFAIALKENQNGRFLRITEEVNDKRNTVIVPEAGFEDFLTVVIGMMELSKSTPPKSGGHTDPV